MTYLRFPVTIFSSQRLQLQTPKETFRECDCSVSHWIFADYGSGSGSGCGGLSNVCDALPLATLITTS